MDNFRRHKQPSSSSSGSLDGFTPSPSKKAGLPTKQFDKSYRSSNSEFTAIRRRPEVNYRQPESFLSNRPVNDNMAITPDAVETMAAETPTIENFEHQPRDRQDKTKKKFFSKKEKTSKPHLSRREKRKRNFKRVGIATLVVILLAGLGLGYVYMKVKSVFNGDAQGAAALQENPDPKLLNGEGDGRVNILIMGKGGPTQSDGPDLTDTLLLASIDPVQNEAALLSLPRDFYQPKQSNKRINAVYADAKNLYLKSNPKDNEGAEKAGTKALMDAVSKILGVPMHYYVMVDFTAFQKAVDTVGGITIDVKTPVTEQMLLNGKPYFLNIKTGSQQFDGLKALAYARCRHCDSRSDFGRSERQREIIIALKDKIFSSGTYTNPYKIQQLISTFGSNVRTDIGTDEIGRLYEIGQKISSDKIASVSLVDEPNVLITGQNIDGQSIQVPKAGPTNYTEIQSFVRNRLKDSFLANENARIAIFNGTMTAGLASATTTELRSYGYNVTKVANAPTQNYQTTYVIDLTGGNKKYTQSYLEKRMQVSAVGQVPDPAIDTTDLDFVIIIGQNEANRQQN